MNRNCFRIQVDTFRSVLKSKFGGSATFTLPFTTPGGNLLQPPASLVGAIITAVPASILLQLAQPSLRSSIASEFRAGNTPQWYQTLPAPVKSYIESLQTQIAGGGVDLSATASHFTFPPKTTAGVDAAGTGTLSSSTSKAIAAQATAGVAVSFAAAAGLLGLVIAL
jgi:hypothetical protein